MPRTRVFLVVAQAEFTFQAGAQQPGITPYRLDQGPPQSMVRHVLQDADGFIWLGTGDGLARFNGDKGVMYGTN